MTLFIFLTVIQAFIAAGLVILVLMQRSEGGGLGIGGGGSPGGMLSARGAADFLSRATKWFAILFVALSIVLAAVAVDASGQRDFDETLDRTTTSAADTAGDDASAAEVPAEDPLADLGE
ncbi:preprotein translocase subunit SecG [Aurantiacibacter sp. MUD11]|uniref:preprotein translocase subunit SecG n=1 Tax=Aurantiacibacter sp. MUD11 TaxID=3003265 RepID=UPI0022AA3B5D|nr:preprotein translocase subunit SecG [Aurantiacibacter sp. MUD11]WAT18435.1 preprotein translocase subunit SecG [Aurantiacibacter sp. MUD11]